MGSYLDGRQGSRASVPELKTDEIFIELDNTEDSREDEANRLATDHLIPPNAWMLLRHLKPGTATDIRLFAQQFKIAPGILVGRMHRAQMIPVVALQWPEEAGGDHVVSALAGQQGAWR